jgi:hypothetical protein
MTKKRNLDTRRQALARQRAQGIITRKPGRPSDYTPQLADAICFQIATGRSLNSILRQDNMPHYNTVMRWLTVHVEFREKYVRARENSADHYAEKVGSVADETLEGAHDPQAARVAIDAYKWIAAKQQPRKYGDNRHIDLSGVVVDAKVVDAPDWVRELLQDRVSASGAKPLRHVTVDAEAVEVEADEN